MNRLRRRRIEPLSKRKAKKKLKIEVIEPVVTKNDLLQLWNNLNEFDYKSADYLSLNHKIKRTIFRNKKILDDVVVDIRTELIGKTGESKMKIKNEHINAGLIKIKREDIPFFNQMLSPMIIDVKYY